MSTPLFQFLIFPLAVHGYEYVHPSLAHHFIIELTTLVHSYVAGHAKLVSNQPKRGV